MKPLTTLHRPRRRRRRLANLFLQKFTHTIYGMTFIVSVFFFIRFTK